MKNHMIIIFCWNVCVHACYVLLLCMLCVKHMYAWDNIMYKKICLYILTDMYTYISALLSSVAQYATLWNTLVPSSTTYFPPSCSSLTACTMWPSRVHRRLAGVKSSAFSVTISSTCSQEPMILRGRRTLAPRYRKSPFRNTLHYWWKYNTECRIDW